MNLIQLIPESFHIGLIFKIIILIVIFLYVIYTFFLMSQIKALAGIFFVHAENASQIIFIVSIIHFLLSISLFFAALVIL